jgi:MurNAc alpha-1-phosphate uridylyltransferase
MYPIAILAGGLATRIKPISNNLPKSLILINDVPFIDLQLHLLSKAGFKDVVLLVGHLGSQIESHVGNGEKYHLNVSYSYDGSKQQGTGGAIVKALPFLGDIFCVIYGDSYLDMNFIEAISKFQNSEKQGLMSIYKNLDQLHQNNVVFDGVEINSYSKTNPSPLAKYIDHGFSIFRKESFGEFSELNELDLSSVCEKLAIIGQLDAYEVHETFYEIGSFEGIQTLATKLKEKSK